MHLHHFEMFLSLVDYLHQIFIYKKDNMNSLASPVNRIDYNNPFWKDVNVEANP
jgi:hypothetical protein